MYNGSYDVATHVVKCDSGRVAFHGHIYTQVEFEIGYQEKAKNAGEHCCELTLPNLLGEPKK